jgi:hypothetical protein
VSECGQVKIKQSRHVLRVGRTDKDYEMKRKDFCADIKPSYYPRALEDIVCQLFSGVSHTEHSLLPAQRPVTNAVEGNHVFFFCDN